MQQGALIQHRSCITIQLCVCVWKLEKGSCYAQYSAEEGATLVTRLTNATKSILFAKHVTVVFSGVTIDNKLVLLFGRQAPMVAMEFVKGLQGPAPLLGTDRALTVSSGFSGFLAYVQYVHQHDPTAVGHCTSQPKSILLECQLPPESMFVCAVGGGAGNFSFCGSQACFV